MSRGREGVLTSKVKVMGAIGIRYSLKYETCKRHDSLRGFKPLTHNNLHKKWLWRREEKYDK